MTRGEKYQREFIKMRPKVAERDNHQCVLCGAPANHVHHIIFRSHLGKNTMDNLVCLCMDCHKEAHGSKARDIQTILKLYVARKEHELPKRAQCIL